VKSVLTALIAALLEYSVSEDVWGFHNLKKSLRRPYRGFLTLVTFSTTTYRPPIDGNGHTNSLRGLVLTPPMTFPHFLNFFRKSMFHHHPKRYQPYVFIVYIYGIRCKSSPPPKCDSISDSGVLQRHILRLRSF
jgi:hypothetical protein